MAQKQFVCSNFQSFPTPCSYTVTGEEDVVINEATTHIVEEHGLEDTPQLRKDIKASLIDVPGG